MNEKEKKKERKKEQRTSSKISSRRGCHSITEFGGRDGPESAHGCSHFEGLYPRLEVLQLHVNFKRVCCWSYWKEVLGGGGGVCLEPEELDEGAG